MRKLHSWIDETKILIKSVPSMMVLVLFTSVIVMNILANKSIALPFEFLALDCGIIVSWAAFLSMDIITKYFGPRAANVLTVLSVLVNLCVCAVFFVAAKIPGVWGESFVEGSEAVINTAMDNTIGGTWYVLLGSSISFLVSGVVNNSTNWFIGKCLMKNSEGFGTYAVQTYVSTALGQFVDNLTFALLVSYKFFGWTLAQCIGCALAGCLVELLYQIVFSPVGYKVYLGWKKDGVGREYLERFGGEEE